MATAKNRAHRRLVLASSAVARTVDSTLDAIGAWASMLSGSQHVPSVTVRNAGGCSRLVLITETWVTRTVPASRKWRQVPGAPSSDAVSVLCCAVLALSKIGVARHGAPPDVEPASSPFISGSQSATYRTQRRRCRGRGRRARSSRRRRRRRATRRRCSSCWAWSRASRRSCSTRRPAATTPRSRCGSLLSVCVRHARAAQWDCGSVIASSMRLTPWDFC